MDLKYLSNFVQDVNKTNSLNDKIATITKWYGKDGKKLVEHLLPIYRYDVQYFLTSANLKKNSSMATQHASKKYPDLSLLLDDLAARNISGHEAIGYVNGFIEENKEFADLIYKIIDKDIEAHVDVSVINRATDDSIPTFDVALAKPMDEAKGKNLPDFTNDVWFASRKLDGVRLLAVVDEKGVVNCFSRVGNRFETMDKVSEEIKSLGLKSVVFDGEACLIKKDGGDDFAGVMKEIRRKDHTIENIRYKMFDMLTLEEFNSKTSKRTLSDRLEKLTKTFAGKKLQHLAVLDQWKLTEEELAKRQEEASKKGWEGLIIRKDVAYKGKRSFDLLKVKKFHDAEYVVKDVEYDEFPMLQADGKFIKENVVSRLVIFHKGNAVGVGSGLTQDQRVEWKSYPKHIIGKTICVQYFEETVSEKTGKPSLRFPTLKFVYDGKRKV
jgi:DNA ligase-1